MVVVLFRSWRALAFRGVLGVAFGAAALLWPGVTLHALILLLGAYMLLDGVAAWIALGPRLAAGGPRHTVLLVEALVGIAAGLVTFLWPALSTTLLLAVVAAWAVFTGVLEVLVAAWLRNFAGALAIGAAGVASMALGVLIVGWPAAAATALTWCVGLYALGFGLAMLVFSAWVRARDRDDRRDDAAEWSGPSSVSPT